MSNKKYFIGIDGGGTKTESILADEEMNVLRRSVLSGCNPNDIGVKNSCKVIEESIRDLCNGLDFSSIESIFCGISGAKNHTNDMILTLTTLFPKTKIKIESDAILPLFAEFGDGDGVSLICGTGSVCFVKKDGKIHRIGGWGYLIDGSGSGFNIGREVLEGVFKFYDGRGGSEYLYRRVCEKYQDLDSIFLGEIYGKGKPFIASFAPLAFDGAEAGDEYSKKILGSFTSYLSECIFAALDISPRSVFAVITGGIAESHPEICDIIFHNTGCKVSLLRSRPVFGAIIGAYIAANFGVCDDLDLKRCRFNESYKLLTTE